VSGIHLSEVRYSRPCVVTVQLMPWFMSDASAWNFGVLWLNAERTGFLVRGLGPTTEQSHCIRWGLDAPTKRETCPE